MASFAPPISNNIPGNAPQQSQQQVVPDQHSGNGGGPPTIDLNALASYVQQFQQQQQKQQSTTPNPPGLQEALAALLKGNQPIQNATNADATPQNQQQQQTIQSTTPLDKAVPAKDGNGDNNDTPMANSNDPQSLMEQISHLTKSLDEEKSKSKALQEEKKREMKGFLTGIKEYVHSLDGVKDPTAKTKFMQGIENMANNGLPNGIYDIMVSASAQNEANMRTIEALTKGYTELKEKYEGPGQFASESSRFVDPSVRIIDAGSKRKAVEPPAQNKVPLGMWDAFGEDIAKIGYSNQKDLFTGI